VRQVALARFNEGVALYDSGRWSEAVTAFEDVIEHYGDHDNVGFAELAAKALLNKGLLLEAQKRPLDEIAAYDELLSRYGNRDEGVFSGHLAWALYNKARELDKLGRQTEAFATCMDLERRYGLRTECEPALQVALALTLGAAISLQFGNEAEATILYRQALGRSNEQSEEAFDEPAALCLLNLGHLVRKTDHVAEAISFYQQVVSRFEGNQNPAVARLVILALGVNWT
jgi:tetratricopeptide (TPR) repeat protein